MEDGLRASDRLYKDHEHLPKTSPKESSRVNVSSTHEHPEIETSISIMEELFNAQCSKLAERSIAYLVQANTAYKTYLKASNTLASNQP
jgi:hypothetical protein